MNESYITDFISGCPVKYNGYECVRPENEDDNQYVGFTNNENGYNPTITKFAGILKVSSKHIMKHNITKKGVCRKEFIPFAKNLPKIMVKTSRILTGPDEYAIVRFEKMENNIMLCEVDSYTGVVGNTSADENITNIIACCHWTTKHNKLFSSLSSVDLTPNRETITDVNIYAIDPDGCIDVDDAIHIKNIDSGYELGIHIADVSSYIEQNSLFDSELSKRASSVYLHKFNSVIPIHMIPECLSIHEMSLLKGQQKRAFSIIIQINKACEITSVNFKKTYVTITDNISYENAQHAVNNNLNADISLMYKTGHKLHNKLFDCDSDSSYDVHKMIEIFMLYANKLVAEKIANHDKVNALFRVQYKRSNIFDTIDNNIIYNTNIEKPTSDQYLTNMNNSMQQKKAIYKLGTNNSRHESLKLLYYTHFTSPIRRYADIIIHRQLWDSITNNIIIPPTLTTLFNINFYSNLYNKVSNYSKLQQNIKEIEDVVETNAFVILIRQTLNNVILYIPSNDITYNYTLINAKFKHLVKFEGNENGITLTHNITGKSTKVDLFQSVAIKIVKLNKSFEKIKVSLLNQTFNLFDDDTV